MTEWNYDLSLAPKGYVETRERINGRGKVSIAKVFVPERIIAASRDGHTVTVTRWMPNQNKWEMFATDEVPIAWMPWPEHPGETA